MSGLASPTFSPTPRVPVESVMRKYSQPFFSGRLPAWATLNNPPPWRMEGLQPLAEVAAPVIAVDAPEMPHSQKLALLTLRSGQNRYAKECAEILRAAGVVANGIDYRSIAKDHYASLQPSGFHVITAFGIHRAGVIMREIARDNGLHHITRGGDHKHLSARCTCQWTTSAPKSGNGATSLDTHVAKHLAAVRAGTNAPAQVSTMIAEMVS